MPNDPISEARKFLADNFDMRLVTVCREGRIRGEMVGLGSKKASEAARIYNQLADLQVPA